MTLTHTEAVDETLLIQIVGQLPPATCGVGDHGLRLARQLRSDARIDTCFVVGKPTWQGSAEVDGFAVKQLRSQSDSELVAVLDESTRGKQAVVLVHYVGYTYAKRGCPFWLVRGLERWQQRPARVPVSVLFHEVHGTGPVWTSGFWTSHVQLWLATRLARLADLCRTTTAVTGTQVRGMLPPDRSATVRVTPVFSNLGEPETVSPLRCRKRQIVVFGGLSWRAAAYREHRTDLLAACRALGIERILDIGPPLGFEPELPMAFTQAGIVDADELGRLFSDSLAGYFTYQMPLLGKSTIFAAYCAHGMLPVTFAGNRAPNGDGVRLGQEVLTSAHAAIKDPRSWQQVADSAAQWYSEHRLKRRARQVGDDVAALLQRRDSVLNGIPRAFG